MRNAAARVWYGACLVIAVGFAKLAFAAGDPATVAIVFAVLAHAATPHKEGR